LPATGVGSNLPGSFRPVHTADAGGARIYRPIVRVTSLTVEHADNPLGIDVSRPRFGWKLDAKARGRAQSAYSIRVWQAGTAGNTVVWDSGSVRCADSVGIRYAGAPLVSRTRYHWTVRVHDQYGRAGRWSAPAWFETALMDARDWSAAWIAPGGARPGGCVQLYRDFHLSRPVGAARLYITALGVYTAEINGKPTGVDRLPPGWTDYRRRVQYQTYDVTALLRRGTNTIVVHLTPGWYAGRIATAGRGLYGSRPALLAQLEVLDATGDTTVVGSDHRWRGRVGGLVAADLLDGESYDARREDPERDGPRARATRGQPVTVTPADPAVLVAQRDPPMKVIQDLPPSQVNESRPGVYLVDLGRNIAGTVRLGVRGASRGDRITLRYAEALEPDGRLHTDNLRTAAATDRYTAAGGHEQVYEPVHTVHGFRYVEVTGLRTPVDRQTVTGRVIGTDTARTGWLRTSDPMLNRLHEAIVWTQRANFTTVPTDCPQRDERLGWTGEAAVFAPTAVYTMDCRRSLGEKWLADLRDAQEADGAVPDVAPYVTGQASGNPGWGDAIVAIPYAIWETYGDAAVINDNYTAMLRWIGWVGAGTVHHILPDTGWGDWTTTGESTPRELVNTACYVRSLDQVAVMAAATGHTGDARRLRLLAGSVRAAFVRSFLDGDARLAGDTQAAYALALSLDLVPTATRKAMVGHLLRTIQRRDWHLSTGVIATPHLFAALSDNGHVDVAYRMLRQRTFPSWGYQLAHGATTLWEHWDSVRPDGSLRDPAMNSLNHYVHGAVGAWMYRTIGGINPDPRRPGYRHTIIRPRPGGGLISGYTVFESVRGRVATRWRCRPDAFELEVRIPANTTATVHVPARDPRRITEGGRPAMAAEGVTFVGSRERCALFDIGSGRYRFAVDEPPPRS
jgi:alpha-L-rhamnosidase